VAALVDTEDRFAAGDKGVGERGQAVTSERVQACFGRKAEA
jgi:hypothetical protein